MRIASLVFSTVLVLTLSVPSAAWPHGDPDGDIDLPRYSAAPPLAGNFTIATSDALGPSLRKLADAFMTYHPNLNVTIVPLSEAALRRFAVAARRHQPPDEDPVRIVASLGLLSSEELEGIYSRVGYPPTAVSIGLAAVAIYVRADHPLHRITLDELDGIFSHERMRGAPRPIDRWGLLGLTDRWTATPIVPLGHPRRSFFHALFERQVLNRGTFHDHVREAPDGDTLRANVAGDATAIGYDGLAAGSPGLRPLDVSVHAEGPYVSPTVDAACKGHYPLSVLAYLYINKAPWGALTPDAQEFLLFATSQQGQAALAGDLLPLPASRLQANHLAIKGLVGR